MESNPLANWESNFACKPHRKHGWDDSLTNFSPTFAPNDKWHIASEAVSSWFTSEFFFVQYCTVLPSLLWFEMFWPPFLTRTGQCESETAELRVFFSVLRGIPTSPAFADNMWQPRGGNQRCPFPSVSRSSLKQPRARFFSVPYGETGLDVGPSNQHVVYAWHTFMSFRVGKFFQSSSPRSKKAREKREKTRVL